LSFQEHSTPSSDVQCGSPKSYGKIEVSVAVALLGVALGMSMSVNNMARANAVIFINVKDCFFISRNLRTKYYA
jgi:hypothetical protein